MNTRFSIHRKYVLAAAAAIVLLGAALTASNLFAANERQNRDIRPSSRYLPSEHMTNPETGPGLTAEYRALVAQDTAKQDGPVAVPEQVAPGTDISEALVRWLDEQPEKMGFVTREDALTTDADTMDWLLYQAVHKDVLTQEEADAVQAWHDRRPTIEEAPELLQYQPTYLEPPGDDNSVSELLRGTEAR